MRRFARGFGRRGRPQGPTFVSVSSELVNQLNAQDNGDLAPTPAMLAAYTGACTDLKTAVAAWKNVITHDLSALSAVLARDGGRPVAAPEVSIAVPSC